MTREPIPPKWSRFGDKDRLQLQRGGAGPYRPDESVWPGRALAGVLASTKDAWRALRQTIARYLANDDPFAAIGNAGAFLVWSSQPTYPIYVWFITGRDAWPSLLTWLSTPFFFAVPLVSRRHPLGGRALFAATGILNTILSAKAFGPEASVAWFLLPCLVIAATFFRLREWTVAVPLCLATIASALVVDRLGPPLHAYTPDQYHSLSRLNLVSVAVLSIYLLVSAIRVRWSKAGIKRDG